MAMWNYTLDFSRKYYEFGPTQPCPNAQQAIMSFTYRHIARIRRCEIHGLTMLNSILVLYRNNTVFKISLSCISKVQNKLLTYNFDL